MCERTYLQRATIDELANYGALNQSVAFLRKAGYTYVLDLLQQETPESLLEIYGISELSRDLIVEAARQLVRDKTQEIPYVHSNRNTAPTGAVQ